MADDAIRFKIDDEVYSIDPEDLTIDETDLLEQTRDKPVEHFTGADWARKSTLRVLAFIAIRRKNPAFTLEAAGQIKLTAFADPDDAPKAPARPTRAKAA